MQILLITNNPLVEERLSPRFSVRMVEGGPQQVLIQARDCLHRGYRLYSHPLSGNLRPWETPYTSVAVVAGGGPDTDSISRIEDAVQYCRTHPAPPDNLPEALLRDYRLVDCALIEAID